MIPMDQGAYRWTVNMARRNYWRVFHWYDLDDLIQDGQMLWCKTQRRYPHVTARPHLMRLYQLTYYCWITDLAKARSKRPQEILSCELTAELNDSFLWDSLCGDQSELGTLLVMISRAPDTIKRLLQLLATEHGRQRLARPYRVRLVGRETRNEKLCRLIGVDPTQVDLEGELISYFRHAA